jgi:hypothetical protein
MILPDGSGSWIVVSKATGKPVFETFSQKTVEQVNQDKYEVMTTLEWLQLFNSNVKRGNR